jgi:Arc/MetJ-type ribon-helix-helix transcriptional regulator
LAKERISATVEKETLEKIEKILKRGKFRNKSHIIEAAIELLEERDEK